jgi:hypothetical protein
MHEAPLFDTSHSVLSRSKLESMARSSLALVAIRTPACILYMSQAGDIHDRRYTGYPDPVAWSGLRRTPVTSWAFCKA